MAADNPELERAREALVARARAVHCEDVLAGRAVKLRRSGAELVGPCPVCGGTDRFGANLRKNVFHCRKSGEGGDAIALVRYLDGVGFKEAVERLTGEAWPEGSSAQEGRNGADCPIAASKPASPGEGGCQGASPAARRAERALDSPPGLGNAPADERDYRERERRKAFGIWRHGVTIAADDPVGRYLAARGVGAILRQPSVPVLRIQGELPYWHRAAADDEARVIHTGPALLAAITDGEGRFAGVHCTWIDPDRPGEKIRLPDPDRPGQWLAAKKVRGSKRRAAIRLVDPPDPVRLVVGEGIETVLSVWCVERRNDTAYWSAVDLGHLGGKAAATVPHPTLTKTDRRGRIRRATVPGPWPFADPERDLAAPAGVQEIVLLGDGDSDPFTTEMTLKRAAERWRRPGRTVRIAWAPAGKDFNDLLRSGA